jgi:hypothetical protein
LEIGVVLEVVGVYGGDVVWGTSGSGVFFIYRWSNHSRCECFEFLSTAVVLYFMEQCVDTTIYSR